VINVLTVGQIKRGFLENVKADVRSLPHIVRQELAAKIVMLGNMCALFVTAGMIYGWSYVAGNSTMEVSVLIILIIGIPFWLISTYLLLARRLRKTIVILTIALGVAGVWTWDQSDTSLPEDKLQRYKNYVEADDVEAHEPEYPGWQANAWPTRAKFDEEFPLARKALPCWHGGYFPDCSRAIAFINSYSQWDSKRKPQVTECLKTRGLTGRDMVSAERELRSACSRRSAVIAGREWRKREILRKRRENLRKNQANAKKFHEITQSIQDPSWKRRPHWYMARVIYPRLEAGAMALLYIGFINNVCLISVLGRPRRRWHQVVDRESNEVLYQQAWRELSDGNIQEGLWAQLLAKHNGDTGKTKAAYLDARVKQYATPQPEDHYYELAWQEIEAGRIQDGLWARLLASNNGDDVKTRTAYLAERVKQLSAAEDVPDNP